jgi:hypothetical protein
MASGKYKLFLPFILCFSYNLLSKKHTRHNSEYLSYLGIFMSRPVNIKISSFASLC